MSVASPEYLLCWVIAHAPGNPDGASEFDEWLRTATCVRDNLIRIQGQVGAFCGEAAYALAHLMDGTVVLGSYQFEGKPSEFENPHYWVEKEGYIIDPTAEQYGEFEGPIVIKIGDKHYVYTEDTFRDEPSEVRKVIERGFIGNPGDRMILEACEFTKEPVKPKEYFDPDSFRTICPECPESRCSLCPPELACATRIITGCKQGEFFKGRCQVGTEAHVIYHG